MRSSGPRRPERKSVAVEGGSRPGSASYSSRQEAPAPAFPPLLLLPAAATRWLFSSPPPALSRRPSATDTSSFLNTSSTPPVGRGHGVGGAGGAAPSPSSSTRMEQVFACSRPFSFPSSSLRCCCAPPCHPPRHSTGVARAAARATDVLFGCGLDEDVRQRY